MLSVDFKNERSSSASKQLHIGDTLRVKYNIVEGGKTRVQTFEGILIALSGRGENKTFKVRKIGNRGIGIERTWPLDSKILVDIDVKKSAQKVRRSKLYFLRDLTGKSATRI